MTDTQQPALTRSPGRSWARRVLSPLIVLIVAGGILLFSQQRGAQHTQEVEQAVWQMLHELGTGEPLSDVSITRRIEASRALIAELETILAERQPGMPGLSVIVLPGDEAPPYGDGRATHRAWISMHGRTRLLVRLHHPGDVLRIRALGYRVETEVP